MSFSFRYVQFKKQSDDQLLPLSISEQRLPAVFVLFLLFLFPCPVHGNFPSTHSAVNPITFSDFTNNKMFQTYLKITKPIVSGEVSHQNKADQWWSSSVGNEHKLPLIVRMFQFVYASAYGAGLGAIWPCTLLIGFAFEKAQQEIEAKGKKNKNVNSTVNGVKQ